MINKTILVGRTTKELELRETGSGIKVCKFTLAVNDTFGEKKTNFIQCIAWSKTAENMCRFVSKGGLIGIEGRIQTGSYEKDGSTVYTTEVICDNVQFLESKPKQEVANDTFSF